MPIIPYLQLQPIDPQDDGSVSDLDAYEQDEVIDLSTDTSGEDLIREWDEIEHELHDSQDSQVS